MKWSVPVILLRVITIRIIIIFYSFTFFFFFFFLIERKSEIEEWRWIGEAHILIN